MNSLLWNLKRLHRFGGRQSRGRFWPYAAAVVALAFAAIGVGMSVAIAGVFEAAERIATTHPDQVTVTRGPASYSVSVSGNHPELMPDFGVAFGTMGVVVAVLAVLLAAAVTRRLHDSGRAGWWGLAPLVFISAGVFGMSRLMAIMMSAEEPSDAEILPMFGIIFINNMLYLASLGLLVVFLALPGTTGANRHGDLADQD